MEVIATKQGTYGGRLREVGEKFTLTDRSHKGSWMAAVDSDDAAGVARQREPIATPARAETGPNPGIAAQYAEAGFQTTALLIEMQELRVENGELKTQAAEAEALRRRIDELTAQLADRSKPATVKQVEKATEKAIETAREDAAEQLNAAIEAAGEAQADPNRSEDGDAVEAVADTDAPAPAEPPTVEEAAATPATPDEPEEGSRRTRRLRRT